MRQLVDLRPRPRPPLGVDDAAPDLGVPVGVGLVPDGQGDPRVLLEVLVLLPVRLGVDEEPVTVTEVGYRLVDALARSGGPATIAAYAVEEQGAFLGATATTLAIAFVTDDYFRVMGVVPVLGR